MVYIGCTLLWALVWQCHRRKAMIAQWKNVITMSICVRYATENLLQPVGLLVLSPAEWTACVYRWHTTWSGRVVRHHSTVTLLFEMGFSTLTQPEAQTVLPVSHNITWALKSHTPHRPETHYEQPTHHQPYKHSPTHIHLQPRSSGSVCVSMTGPTPRCLPCG